MLKTYFWTVFGQEITKSSENFVIWMPHWRRQSVCSRIFEKTLGFACVGENLEDICDIVGRDMKWMTIIVRRVGKFIVSCTRLPGG
jgi:hypothetical protein